MGLPGLRLRHPVRAGGNERTLEGHDPFDIDMVLKWNAEVFHAAARRHYVLLKDASDTDSDRYLRDYNVQVIPYSDHSALPGILEALRGAGTNV